MLLQAFLSAAVAAAVLGTAVRDAQCGGASADLAPTHPVEMDVLDEVCSCSNGVNWPTPTQLPMGQDCERPLIVVSNRELSHGTCPVDGVTCGTPGSCKGSVDVQVSFPSGTSCYGSVWVKAGEFYPIPTEINDSTEQISLTPEAGIECNGEPVVLTIEVWINQPFPAGPGGGLPDPDAQAKITFSCDECKFPTPVGGG